MKMEPIVSSETSAIRTQTPGNYPKRNSLHKNKMYSLLQYLVQSAYACGGIHNPYVGVSVVLVWRV